MTPKEKCEQIENEKNWIVEFWRARGYDNVKTALGISFTLHRSNPRHECLGLDLTYLEQFAKESSKRLLQEQAKEILVKVKLILWNKSVGLNCSQQNKQEEAINKLEEHLEARG